MTKTASLLFLFFFLISCSKAHASKAKGPAPVAAPEVPPEALTWDADVYLVNFDSAQEAKVHKAVELIKKVIATKVFRDRVLNYTYKGKKRFVDNDGFTNAQIYQKLLSGAEIIGNRKPNNTMDVELELYYENTSTIGYTYPNTVRIWMNKKFFDKYTPEQVADNLIHEWTHKLGFGHAMKWSRKRDHSVPYAIGYLVEELIGKL